MNSIKISFLTYLIPFFNPDSGSLSAVKSYNENGSSGYNLFENGLIAECAYTSFPGVSIIPYYDSLQEFNIYNLY